MNHHETIGFLGQKEQYRLLNTDKKAEKRPLGQKRSIFSFKGKVRDLLRNLEGKRV